MLFILQLLSVLVNHHQVDSQYIEYEANNYHCIKLMDISSGESITKFHSTVKILQLNN